MNEDTGMGIIQRLNSVNESLEDIVGLQRIIAYRLSKISFFVIIVAICVILKFFIK
jgi:hypothetical protein